MDRYTRILLTIIAASLLFIAFRDSRIISNAEASSSVVKVEIVDMNLSRYRPLPVRIEGKLKCED
jgi:hypothetical protein